MTEDFEQGQNCLNSLVENKNSCVRLAKASAASGAASVLLFGVGGALIVSNHSSESALAATVAAVFVGAASAICHKNFSRRARHYQSMIDCHNAAYPPEPNAPAQAEAHGSTLRTFLNKHRSP